MMNKILEYLKSNPVQYLATVGLDGKPKCRPFMFATEYDGKLWFCTSNQKDVYRELIANPSMELTVSAPNFSWCRISGDIRFENSSEVKQLCINNIPIVKQIYQSADNPIFEVFCLECGRAVMADFSGNPPRVCDL